MAALDVLDERSRAGVGGRVRPRPRRRARLLRYLLAGDAGTMSRSSMAESIQRKFADVCVENGWDVADTWARLGGRQARALRERIGVAPENGRVRDRATVRTTTSKTSCWWIDGPDGLGVFKAPGPPRPGASLRVRSAPGPDEEDPAHEARRVQRTPGPCCSVIDKVATYFMRRISNCARHEGPRDATVRVELRPLLHDRARALHLARGGVGVVEARGDARVQTPPRAIEARVGGGRAPRRGAAWSFFRSASRASAARDVFVGRRPPSPRPPRPRASFRSPALGQGTSSWVIADIASSSRANASRRSSAAPIGARGRAGADIILRRRFSRRGPAASPRASRPAASCASRRRRAAQSSASARRAIASARAAAKRAASVSRRAERCRKTRTKSKPSGLASTATAGSRVRSRATESPGLVRRSRRSRDRLRGCRISASFPPSTGSGRSLPAPAPPAAGLEPPAAAVAPRASRATVPQPLDAQARRVTLSF